MTRPPRAGARPRATLLSKLPDGPAFWTLVLALGVAATQLGSFGEETLHSDEHCFLLMAAHVLDGNLPGDGLFDIKPPLFFYMLAGAFAVFGETLGVARLFGDVTTLALCLVTFAVARRWTGPGPAGLGALLVVAATAGYTGQATLTDAPAMALLMASMGLLLARRGGAWTAAPAGFLASAAALTRLNLAIPVAAMAAWLAFRALRRPGPAKWASLVAFAVAGLALPATFLFLYWRADALAVARLTLIDVPLSYGGQTSVGETLAGQAAALWTIARGRPVAAVAFAGAAVAGAAAALRTRSTRTRDATAAADDGGAPGTAGTRRVDDEFLLAAVLAGAGVAVATAGVASTLYAFMWIPVVAVYAARGIGWGAAQARRLPRPWPERARGAAAAAAAAATSGLLASALHDRATRPPPVQPLRRAAEAVAADRVPSDRVWAVDSPIVSWYLDTESVVPLSFPQNLGKPAVMRPLTESGYLGPRPLEDAMAAQPAYLVVRSDHGAPFRPPGFIERHGARQAELLARWVRDNYSLFHDAGGVAVYKANARP